MDKLLIRKRGWLMWFVMVDGGAVIPRSSASELNGFNFDQDILKVS